MAKTYKDLVFSDHALHRVSLRSLRLEAVYQSIHNPDKSFPQEDGKTKFIKLANDRKYHVVAKKTDQDQWLVISVWVRGEEDPVPLMWQLITLPFKAVWWLLKFLYKLLFNNKKTK